MQVSIDEIRAIQEFVDKVNSVPFDEIEWDFPVDNQDLIDWKFTGLSNWYFALMHGVNK